jgi:RNA polymerase sigma factor (sigma-70 family)
MIYQAAIDESFPVAEPPTQVARLRSSDPAALAEAVGQYQHRLYRYFLRLVRDAASADDLFQQTWLHVVRQLHRYDSTRSFDTWLFAIAHNAAMDLLRRRPNERLEDHEFALPAGTADAFSTVLAGERAAILAAQKPSEIDLDALRTSESEAPVVRSSASRTHRRPPVQRSSLADDPLAYSADPGSGPLSASRVRDRPKMRSSRLVETRTWIGRPPR